MKLNQKIQFFLFASCALFLSILFNSCKKDPEQIAELISNSEAAEIVETALADKTAGFTMPVIDASQIIEAYLNNCNVPGDTTLNKSKSGGAATYSYTFNMNWLVNCSNANLPQSATVDITANGAFNSLHWSGNDATSGHLAYTGLELQAPAYIVNGSYTLNGDITGSLRKTAPSFDCNTQIQVQNLTIDKDDMKITGGAGTVVITGKTASGDEQTLNGAITFNGDGTATVVVNGHTHTFPL